MFGFFNKLRERARAAVLLGVADAADELLGPEPTPADVDRLRALLSATEAKVLAPAEADGEPAAKVGRRK